MAQPRRRPLGTRAPRLRRPSYSSPVSAQSSNAMTPSSVNLVAQPAVGGVEQPELLAVRDDLREQHGLEDLPVGHLHEQRRTTSLGSTPMRSQTSCCRNRSRMRTAASKANSWRSRISAADELRVVLLQAQHAEGDVAGLVGHHVAEQLLEQRLGRHLVHEAEGGQGQALDHDLHAEIGHVPAAVGDDVVEQQARDGR